MSLAFWKQCCIYNLANSEDLQSYNIPIVFPSVQRCPLNSSIEQNNINTVLFPLLLRATLLVLVPEIHWPCRCLLFGLPSTFLAFKYTASSTVSVLEVLVLSQCTLLLWILYWCTTHHKYNSTLAGCWIQTEFVTKYTWAQELQVQHYHSCNRRWCTFFMPVYFLCIEKAYFYRTRVRSLGMLVTNSLTDSLTH